MSDKLKQHRKVSVSSLTKFMKSPKAYHYEYLSGRKTTKVATKAMKDGSAYHCWMLEQKRFYDKFVVDDQNRNSNAYKAVAEQAILDKMTVIKSSQLNAVQMMKSEMKDLNPEIYSFMDVDGECEKTFDGENEIGFNITGNIDKYIPSCKAIIELKTIAKITDERELIKKIIDSYPITVPHYFSLIPEAQYFYFVFQEKEEPYDAVAIQLDEEIIQASFNLYNTVCKSLAYCVENNSWPGISNGRIMEMRAADIAPWQRHKIGLRD